MAFHNSDRLKFIEKWRQRHEDRVTTRMKKERKKQRHTAIEHHVPLVLQSMSEWSFQLAQFQKDCHVWVVDSNTAQFIWNYAFWCQHDISPVITKTELRHPIFQANGNTWRFLIIFASFRCQLVGCTTYISHLRKCWGGCCGEFMINKCYHLLLSL